MKANILVYDVGSTYTKVAAFRLENETLRFLGGGQHPTTLDDINIGTAGAEEMIKRQGVCFDEGIMRFSSCSAAGGLRMVALGYMPRVTAKAAKEVAMTAGARVMEVVSCEEPPQYRVQVLKEINPDIILLSGGTDGGDEQSIRENADVICAAGGKATVIVACNKHVQHEVANRLARGGVFCICVPNIMPTIHELNVKPARDAIHEQFIRQITRAKGLERFCNTLEDKTVIPTPGAALLACELLAGGSYDQEGLGGIILLDVGGATTDIHSALPGLSELSLEELGLILNNEKQFSYRTVEGNLGLRVSAAGIVDAVGPQSVIRRMDTDFGVTAEEIHAYVRLLEADTGRIAADEKELCIDRALASCAVSVGLRRHAGHFAREADPLMGVAAGTPIGRDLRNVKLVLCTGGVFTYCRGAVRHGIVGASFREPGISLLPQEEPKIWFDENYILYAMGVLSKRFREPVLNLMKSNLENDIKNDI